MAPILGLNTCSHLPLLSLNRYATAFVGSFSFMAFALYAYQVGKSADRSATYFRGRLFFYALLMALAGLSQLLLGSYVRAKFGGGPLSPPVGVAMYVVHFPAINIVVGALQLLTGVFGVFRRFGKFIGGKDDHRYQMAIFFVWICMLSMQVITQVGYAPGGDLAPAAPTIACLSVGLCALPAFLDFKMRNLPELLPADYYGIGDGYDKSDVEAGEKEKVNYAESTEFNVDAGEKEKISSAESTEFNVDAGEKEKVSSAESTEFNA